MSEDNPHPPEAPFHNFATQGAAIEDTRGRPLNSHEAPKRVDERALRSQSVSSGDTLPSQAAIEAHGLEAERKGSKQIVTIGLSDPKHPNNWSFKKKSVVVISGIMSVLNSTLGSSLPSGAIDPIAKHFNVTNQYQMVLPVSCYLMGYTIGPVCCGPLSENFGRKPVMLYSFMLYIIFTMACAVAPTWASLLVFRLFCGIMASAPIAITGGMYADVYSDARKRGMSMLAFMVATSCGPSLAPPISGFIGENVSWRWVFGVGTFFALAALPFLILMPESYLPILISKKAEKLRKETGDNSIVASSELEKASMRYIITVVLTRPYRMLVQEMIVACICIYALLVYAIFYLYFEVYPIIFQGPDSVYHFSAGLAGLTFLPIAIGGILAGPIIVLWDSRLAKAQANGEKWSQKEEYRRLPLACIGGPLYMASIFWIGWSAKPDIHWIVPTLSGLTFGMSFLFIFFAILNYLSDAYVIYAASAAGIASTCRSIGGAVVPLAAKSMFTKLGIDWACSLLAFLTLAVSVIPFIFIWKGDTIRANSKFCQALKKMREEELAKEAGQESSQDEEDRGADEKVSQVDEKT